MAVLNLRKSGYRTALVLALAALGLPGVSTAQPWSPRGDERPEDQRRDNDRASARARERGREQQQAQPPQAQQQPRNWTPSAPPQQPAPAARTSSWRDDSVDRGGTVRDRQRQAERPRGPINWTDAEQSARPSDHAVDRAHEREREHERERGTGWSSQRQADRDDWHSADRGDHYQANRWDSRWRSNPRYDWSGYRRGHPQAYRIGTYYAPYRGYGYRRLGIGFVLNSLFFADRYWINDPWDYRLPEVYGPYRWVRYYDDALLVDIYSGRVVDVIYGLFW